MEKLFLAALVVLCLCSVVFGEDEYGRKDSADFTIALDKFIRESARLIEQESLEEKDYNDLKIRLNKFCAEIQVIRKLQAVIQDGEAKLLYLDNDFFLMVDKEWMENWLKKLKRLNENIKIIKRKLG